MKELISTYDNQVGQRLRQLRLERGVSQAYIASELGVSSQQVQKYEKGIDRISAGKIQHLASVFKVQPSAFFEEIIIAPSVDSRIDAEGARVFKQLTRKLKAEFLDVMRSTIH